MMSELELKRYLLQQIAALRRFYRDLDELDLETLDDARVEGLYREWDRLNEEIDETETRLAEL